MVTPTSTLSSRRLETLTEESPVDTLMLMPMESSNRFSTLLTEQDSVSLTLVCPLLPVAPVDTPEVAEAKAAHLAAVAAAAPAERKRREAAFSYGFGTAHPTYAYGYAGLPHAAGLPYAAGLPHAGLGYAGLGYGLPYHG